MKLEDLIERLELAFRQPLPGASAHNLVRAVPISEVRPEFRSTVPPKRGGVLILFYEDKNLVRFPLIKRPAYPGIHGGQVSLPGGKAEPGEEPVATALREGEEEIGIDRSAVKVIGQLSEFHVIPSNFVVNPVIAVSETKPLFTPDPREVERILIGEMDALLDAGAVRTKEIIVGGTYRLNAPHFEVDNEMVWGATAMILNELRIMLRQDLFR